MGASGEKVTSSSGSPAIERTATATARLKGSEGFSFFTCLEPSRLALRHQYLGGGFGELFAEAALIEFGNRRPFQLVALVQERDPEGETDVAAEDRRVL